MSARDEVLARVRDAHRLAPPPDLAYEAVERAYRTSRPETTAELLELLADRLTDYKASVRRCAPEQLAATLAAALTDRGARTVAVPPGLPAGWLDDADVVALRDATDADGALSVDRLDGVDGVVTGCALAVAETGTLVLDASPDQGRRVLTLVPDYHLCVVLAHQVVADVPQALAQLVPTRPTTMISGPSATSDIELNRVEGVHGPRTLEVVLVAATGEDGA